MSQAKSKLRILLVTEADPLYVINFFDVFFAEYPRDEFEIVGLTVQKAFHESKLKTAKRILKFYGPVDFCRLLTRFAVTKLSGRSIEKLGVAASIPLIETSSVNDPAYLERLRGLKLDAVVSVAAPEIFKAGILSIPRLGCVNIHNGKLPKYRGMMPNFWQLLEGERSSSMTIHEMVERLDAGRVIAEREFPLHQKDSLDRVIVGTKREGARFMIETLRELAAGSTNPTPLDMSIARYYKFPKPEDVAKFRALGHRMI